MTIARYCGGLFVALSFAAVGVAVGCTQPVDDPDAGVEEAVAEEELALSGEAMATGASSDGKDDECKKGECVLWEAELDISSNARWLHINADNDCEVLGAKVDGEFLSCDRQGPRCKESGFAYPDCRIRVDGKGRHKKVMSDGKRNGDDDVEVLIYCEDGDKPKVEIAEGQGNNCDELDDDDVELDCLAREDEKSGRYAAPEHAQQ